MYSYYHKHYVIYIFGQGGTCTIIIIHIMSFIFLDGGGTCTVIIINIMSFISYVRVFYPDNPPLNIQAIIGLEKCETLKICSSYSSKQ